MRKLVEDVTGKITVTIRDGIGQICAEDTGDSIICLLIKDKRQVTADMKVSDVSMFMRCTKNELLEAMNLLIAHIEEVLGEPFRQEAAQYIAQAGFPNTDSSIRA